jgi:hypothetical protein
MVSSSYKIQEDFKLIKFQDDFSLIIPGLFQAQQKMKVRRITRGQLLAHSIVVLSVHSWREMAKIDGMHILRSISKQTHFVFNLVSSLLRCAAPNHDQMCFLKPLTTTVNR